MTFDHFYIVVQYNSYHSRVGIVISKFSTCQTYKKSVKQKYPFYPPLSISNGNVSGQIYKKWKRFLYIS